MFPAKYFYYLSKFIGTKWKQFGLFLNVPETDIQNIDSSKSISVLEKPFQMLWMWFRKQENASWEFFIDKLMEYGNQTWINEANGITEKLKQIGSLSPVCENNGAMKDCYLKDYHIFLSELLSKNWYVFGVEMQLDLTDLDVIRSSKKSNIDGSYEMLCLWGDKTHDTSWRECRKQLTYNKEWNSVIRIMDSYIKEGNDQVLRNQTQLAFYQNISQYLNEELTILSKHLKIDNAQLELIYQAFPTSKEKAFEILLLWDNQQLIAPELDDFKVIFQKIGRNDLVKIAEELFQSNKSNIMDNMASIEDLEKPLDDFKLFLSGKIATCWYEVGIALSVNKNKLEDLRSIKSNEADKAYEMLTAFGCQSCSPTWKTVKKALEKLEYLHIIKETGQHLEISKSNYVDSMGYIQMYDDSIQDLEKPLDQFKLFLSNKLAICWYEVGIALSVNKNKLEDIHAAKSKEADKAYEMLTVFGYQHHSPTWKTVRNVLKELKYWHIIQETDQYLGGERHIYNELELIPGSKSHQNIKPSISQNTIRSTSSVVGLRNTARTNHNDFGKVPSTLSVVSLENKATINHNDLGLVNKRFIPDFTDQAGSSSANDYYEKPKGSVEPLPTACNKFYPMVKKCSGICLLFVTDSDELKLVNRNDEKLLRKTFSYLRFQVIVKRNKSNEEILRIIEKKGFKNFIYDCFVVCVLCRNSANSANSAESNRSVLQTDSMAARVINLTSLQNKPKLFFIQAWETATNQSNTNQHDINMPYMLNQNVGNDKDIFFSIAQGTLLNFNATQGSWYVKNLCEILTKNATTSSLVGMLSMLGDKFRCDCNNNYVNEVSEMNLHLKFRTKKKTALCVLL